MTTASISDISWLKNPLDDKLDQIILTSYFLKFHSYYLYLIKLKELDIINW